MVDVSEKQRVENNPNDDVTRGMKRYSTDHGSLKTLHYLKNSKDLGGECYPYFITREMWRHR